jgi:small subunit ribosomal protein S13
MNNSIQFFEIQIHLTKKLNISLSKIFGISFSKANFICQKFGFTRNSLVNDVNLNTFSEIRKFILMKYSIQNDLRKNIQNSISDLILIKSIKGLRHRLKLPVRGQRTRSNHKTQKNLFNKKCLII